MRRALGRHCVTLGSALLAASCVSVAPAAPTALLTPSTAATSPAIPLASARPTTSIDPAELYGSVARTFDDGYAQLVAAPTAGLQLAHVPAVLAMLDAASSLLEPIRITPGVTDLLTAVANARSALAAASTQPEVLIAAFALTSDVEPAADAVRAALGLPSRGAIDGVADVF